METIDALGHVGYAAIVVGHAMLARWRSPWGFVLRIVGELVWLGLGVALGLTSVWFWSGMFVVIDAAGFARWRGEEASCRTAG